MISRLSTRVNKATSGTIRAPAIARMRARESPPDAPALRRRPRCSCSVPRVHIVIMGCGRVGSALALHCSALDHSVAVIDQDPLAFRRLGDNFPGTTSHGRRLRPGHPDRGRHREADAFAAVSSGDNSNIIAARVARETFGVRQRRRPHL